MDKTIKPETSFKSQGFPQLSPRPLKRGGVCIGNLRESWRKTIRQSREYLRCYLL